MYGMNLCMHIYTHGDNSIFTHGGENKIVFTVVRTVVIYIYNMIIT